MSCAKRFTPALAPWVAPSCASRISPSSTALTTSASCASLRFERSWAPALVSPVGWPQASTRAYGGEVDADPDDADEEAESDGIPVEGIADDVAGFAGWGLSPAAVLAAALPLPGAAGGDTTAVCLESRGRSFAGFAGT